jgi:hypothetical protein
MLIPGVLKKITIQFSTKLLKKIKKSLIIYIALIIITHQLIMYTINIKAINKYHISEMYVINSF